MSDQGSTCIGGNIPFDLHHLLPDLGPTPITADDEIKRNLDLILLALVRRLILPLLPFLSWFPTLLGLRISDIAAPVDSVELGFEAELHAVGVGGEGLDETKVEKRSWEGIDALICGWIV
jgi:hypothetical protein